MIAANQIFPLSLALLCAAASGVYCFQQHWALATIWAAYAVADAALAAM